MTQVGITVEPAVQVDRWPSETPLRVLVCLTAIGLWVVLAVSLIGIAYAVFLGIFFFVAHISFIAHLRGSAVRLSPHQMPELYERVVALSQRIGLRKVPDPYIVQAGGALNALATRFLRSNFVVLYSDLLEACGDNVDARDFIIGHELGHLRAGHLRWRWLLLPGLFTPFLGSAYSRACEYTCDRYGLALSTNGEQALDGLCILAAGGKHGPRVNRRALVAQRSELNTIWMKIGQWLAMHPPIALRLAALQPSLAEGRLGGKRAALGAALVLVLTAFIPLGVAALSPVWLPWIKHGIEASQTQEPKPEGTGEEQQAVRRCHEMADRMAARGLTEYAAKLRASCPD